MTEAAVEVWELVNRQREKTGVLHVRGTPLPSGMYHQVAGVWLMSTSGRFLMSRRHLQKPYGGYWECTSGAMLPKETSEQAVLREAEEELGIMLDRKYGHFVRTIRRDAKQDFYDIWLFLVDEAAPIRMQPEEVIDARWMTPEEVKELHAQKKLHPLLESIYPDILVYGRTLLEKNQQGTL